MERTDYDVVFNPTKNSKAHQEAYTLRNASMGVNSSSGKWSVGANVKNITNYAVKKSYSGMGAATLLLGDPRTYEAALSLKF